MLKTTTHNVVRFIPISGSSQTHKFRIDKWDIDVAVSLVDLGQYRYFWFEKVHVTRDQSQGKITIFTKIANRSANYFINAYVKTYADVKVCDHLLSKQMENLGWTHIAKNLGSKSYWTEQFRPDVDVLVDLDGQESRV